jgi:EAL domain-containing protein (putative c-di-GMP-specific phosphodiesterase class I)
LPVDTLKIDQSFVQAIGSSRDEAIIGAVVAMGTSLKQCVIAEGVETQAQLDFLKSLYCEEGQGFLFGRPVVAEEFAAMFESGEFDRPTLEATDARL